jgi:hypothetical protein
MRRQQGHGPSRGAESEWSRILGQDLGQEFRVQIIGLARTARASGIGQVLDAMFSPVQIDPAMHAGPIYARLPRRLADRATFGYAQHGLDTTKQTNIANFPERLGQMAAVLPGEAGNSGTLIFLHASIVTCCKTFGYLYSPTPLNC